MSLKKCFSIGALKHTKSDINLAYKSLSKGEHLLKEVQALLENEFHEAAQLRLYQAYFHMIKSLLYKDGIKEHSHACLLLYAKEKYPQLGDTLDIMTLLKDFRNQIQYSVDTIGFVPQDISQWVTTGYELAKKVKSILSTKAHAPA